MECNIGMFYKLVNKFFVVGRLYFGCYEWIVVCF